jgi:DNA-binding MarR family transcriptional regulator
VLDAVRRIVQVLRVSSRAAEKLVGLSAAQLFVLHRLEETQAISLNELAERTLTHQSSVSVVVQRLVGRGLVSRERSRADARRIELKLTAAARALLRKAPGAAQDKLIDAVGALPAAQQKQLAALLGQLVEAMGVAAEPAGMFFEEGKSAPARRKARMRRQRG